MFILNMCRLKIEILSWSQFPVTTEYFKGMEPENQEIGELYVVQK